MLGLLTTLAYSDTVSSTGYNFMYISRSSTDLEFDLTAKSDADYYFVLFESPSTIYIDGNSLSYKVYKISYTSATYKISKPSSSSSSDKFNFGIFLIPKTYDSLEFWIEPASETYRISKSSSSSYSYDHYLVICDYTPISVSVKKSDSNYVYYSISGGIPDSSISDSTLSSKYTVTLHYHQNSGYSASTTYSVSPSYTNTNANYKYYDNSKSEFIFSNGISIRSLSSGGSSSGGSSSYGSIVYGSNSETISSSTTYSIPMDALIVFTQSESIEGEAICGSTSLDILGSTDIKAILFSSSGTLTLKSTSGSQTCNFIVYEYSKFSSYCYYVTILSGTVKYKLDLDDNRVYCVVSAFTSGQVDIDADDLYHTSYGHSGSEKYSSTYLDKYDYNPIITVTYNQYSYSSGSYTGKIEFKIDGSSSDDNYAIDGYDSKYNFYMISSSSYSKMNSGSTVGKASVGGGLPAWAIVIIVIVVIIIVIAIICTICCICCCSSGCCSSSSSSTSNNHHEERQVETVQEDHPTPVQTNTAPASYYSPPPSQPPQQQQQQAQPNYTPPPSYNVPPQQVNPYNSPSAQPQQPPSSVYGAPPQQPVYGAPPQQPVYGAPPQQTGSYIAPAPSPAYNSPDTKEDYDNPYY